MLCLQFVILPPSDQKSMNAAPRRLFPELYQTTPKCRWEHSSSVIEHSTESLNQFNSKLLQNSYKTVIRTVTQCINRLN